MPLYEYQCNDCNERAEILQKVSDPPYTHCPKCGGGMRKLLSAPAIQFKGSGFYKTDYASRPSGKPETKSDAAASGPAETKTETKTETKSDSSAGTKGE